MGVLLALAVVLLLLARLPPRRPAPAPAPALAPAPVLTRALYEAGHARAHPELCPRRGARTRLVILVSSAPAHAAARSAVRLTWGHAALRADVVLGFVLGASPPELRAALDREDALYGDLIESRSVDSYSNLTLKTLSMLEWFGTYCPRARRLLKTDDDVFINVPRLLAFAAARANATRTVWGRVARRYRPARAPRFKYYVPPAQFPGAVFPDFATGPAYLLTADAARRLLLAAPEERYLRLEDVFVTGVLAARADVRRVHHAEFYNKKVRDPCAVQRGLAVHMVQYDEQFDLWRKLLAGKTECATKTKYETKRKASVMYLGRALERLPARRTGTVKCAFKNLIGDGYFNSSIGKGNNSKSLNFSKDKTSLLDLLCSLL